MAESTHDNHAVVSLPYGARPGRTFAGFAAPTSNTTFTPNQFFDACLPYHSRGVVRLVAYLIRKTLGWCDREGNPQEEEIAVSYRELIDKAGISRDMVRQALDEAEAGHFIECVREGRAKTVGDAGQSARYRLRWDPSPEYRKRPADFRGFFEGEGNRTDIPNQFFDVIVPGEPLSIVKAVGAIIRFSIGYQAKRGTRRQQVALSYRDIERYARIGSPVDLSNALRVALEKNYLVRLESGVFSHRSDLRKPAIYALRWADDWVGRKNIAGAEASEIRSSNGQKIESAERSKIQSNIQMKPLNETFKPQAADPATAVEILKREGFGETASTEIARLVSLETIERQIAWLERRAPSRNRLGMLRKAIVEDWPEPEKVGSSQLAGGPGFELARFFYASLAGNLAEPVSEPSPRDCEIAAGLMKVIQTAYPGFEPKVAGTWLGQLAGQMPKPIPSLQLAVRQSGDLLLVRIRQRREADRQATAEAEKLKEAARLKELAARYLDFLRGEEGRIRAEQPDEYARFAAHRDADRAKQLEGPIGAQSPWWRDWFESESARLVALRDFFQLPASEQWQASLNLTSQP